MKYWLVKSEPEECGIDDFVAAGQETIRWDGVRNYQARNFMRDMSEGDQVLLYHSSCQHIGIAGVIEVARAGYDDPAQFDPYSAYFDPKARPDNPRWTAVDMRLVEKWPRVLPLATLRAHADQMEAFALLAKGARLSVMPVSTQHWRVIQSLR